MIEDLGDAIKPYLRSLYESVRHYPGLDTGGMTSSSDIDAILPEVSGNKINTPPIISAIVKRLTGEGYKGIAEARTHLSELAGIPIKTGTNETKQADEALELAAVVRAREIVRNGTIRGQSSHVIYNALVDLYENKMPNLNVRTSTSVEQQAYSTPVPLAFVASRLAGINQESVVSEPTAGNGALLIVTDPKRVFANELNADRAVALRSQGYVNVSEKDGTTWNPPQKVDSVIANPPFGVVRDDKGDSKSFKINERYTTNEIDHAIVLNSLKAMKDDGTAVLILGGIKSDDMAARSDAYNSKSKRAFYLTLYSEYIVADHFTVSGNMYAKQGATWPVDVIVIKGRGKSTRSLPAVDVPRIINDYVELGKELKNEQSSSNSQSVGILAGQGEGKPAVPKGTGSAVTGSGDVRGVADGNYAGILPGHASNTGGVRPSGNSNTKQAADNVSDEPGISGRDNTKQSPPGLVRTDTKEEAETSGQVHYVPTSQTNNIGTLVPKNMGTAIKEALSALEQRVGNIDNYVAKQLDYKLNDLSQYFSAEQVDALGLAIDNISNGGGFIIGDQCVSGGTRIYDPVENTYTPIRDLAAAGNPINVLSLTPIGLIPMGAYAPFLKGEADLYKVILDDGREISVTSGHRFLSQDGWTSISDGLRAGHFLASSVGRSLSSLEFSRLTHDGGAQHSTETPQDCLARCFAHRHQYDAQLHSEEDTFQKTSPLQGDAREHNHLSFYMDGLATLAVSPYQAGYLLA